ncbi:LrgB family protein [Sphingobium lignivorans]|uniref:Murein hydrolase (TIGR00659 family) n=1 Tax=Sphingobium lignivorans TaxID=2735886 RepID=A0ABR6NGD5_9SPHN|nr:LrgB family protein [Sphingobium lignivorans]MBB5986343.1 putative murein hydrolase (TIGR00659 family) [Sphingobium lignivorans]
MSAILAIPIFWLVATLIVFEGADILSRRSGRHPLCHPVLLATPALIGLLLATGTPYPAYRESTALLNFLLGPAVVGLAVPIWKQRRLIRRLAKPLALALLAGAATAITSVVSILWLFGAPPEILASAAPRATTTPVAIEMAAQLGGIPALTTAIVLCSGILGAMIATPIFDALKISDFRARGFSVGISAHGLGAARAFQVNSTAGAFASLGMALNAVATCVMLSLIALLV